MSLFGDTSTRPNTYIIDLQLNVCPQKGPQAWIWLVNWKSISMAVLSHKRMPFSPALFCTKMPAPHTNYCGVILFLPWFCAILLNHAFYGFQLRKMLTHIGMQNHFNDQIPKFTEISLLHVAKYVAVVFIDQPGSKK